MDFERYKMSQSTFIKYLAQQAHYLKHAAHTSCLLALGIISFLFMSHSYTLYIKTCKEKPLFLAVFMFLYEKRLSRLWHQASMLRRRQGRLMDEPQGRGFSLTHCEQEGMTSDLPIWGRTSMLLFPSKTSVGYESVRG